MHRDDRHFLRVGMFYTGAVALIVLLALLYGCGKTAPQSPVLLADGTVSAGSGTVYEIPVEQVKDKEIPETPGKDKDDTLVVVTVPPSPVATTVRVHHRPKPLAKKAKEVITGDRGSPEVSVTSDNPGVKAESERSTGLWPWIAGAFAFIGGIIAARRWLKRFAWVTRLLSWAKGLIGL